MNATASYDKLPATANNGTIKSYTIDIPESKIKHMKELIELSNLPDSCFENSQPDDGREYGVRLDWMGAMKKRWLSDFNWKKHQNHLNSFPNFIASVEDPESSGNPYSIHFAALFSSREDALPIVLLHGWPGSFLEFIPMLSIIKKQYDPSSLPYHIIVPSLPGFGLSARPPVKQPLHSDGDLFGMETVARIMNTLMGNLFGSKTKYVAQGGDIGSRIARILAAMHPNCAIAHLNFCAMPKPPNLPDQDLDEFEQKALERFQWFQKKGSAYAIFQATKPGTLGFVLSSSPLAVLAWIGEKFLDWTDPASFPSEPPHSSASSEFAEDILLGASLYWLSGNIATTFYTYKETFPSGSTQMQGHANPRYHIKAPKMLALSGFPMELASVPMTWVATTGNLIWSKRHDKGGHFAALEQPQVLWGDIEEVAALVKKSL